MDNSLTILNWYLIYQNGLSMNKEQLQVVRDIQLQIGTEKIHDIVDGLKIKNSTGEFVDLEEIVSDRSMSRSVIKTLRFQFAAGLFSALFALEVPEEEHKAQYDLLNVWCGDNYNEKGQIINIALTSQRKRFEEARKYLLGL